MESIVTAQEVIQFTKRNRIPGYMLKLDFEKAYDMADWECIIESLQASGFCPKWLLWIKLWLSFARVSLLIIGSLGWNIACKRGLTLGDPLSPLIFVLAANGLYFMVKSCQKKGLLKGMGCRDETNAIINLHYADDTLIFGEECVVQAVILKCILYCFEEWSGLRINFHKSALSYQGTTRSAVSLYHKFLAVQLKGCL